LALIALKSMRATVGRIMVKYESENLRI